MAVTDLEGQRTLRSEHIAHEHNLRAGGAVFLLGAAVLAATSVLATVLAFQGQLRGFYAPVLLVVEATILGAIGHGLFMLRPWVRLWAVFIAVCGLVLLPFGTVASALILRALLQRPTRVVLSETYQVAMRATTDMKRPWTGTLSAIAVCTALELALFVAMQQTMSEVPVDAAP